MTVMSDISIMLHEPFSRNIVSGQDFQYRKKDQVILEGDTLEDEYEKKYLSVTKKIQKEKDNPVLEYREKYGMWGYK